MGADPNKAAISFGIRRSLNLVLFFGMALIPSMPSCLDRDRSLASRPFWNRFFDSEIIHRPARNAANQVFKISDISNNQSRKQLHQVAKIENAYSKYLNFGVDLL
jgi:hypothetical protein